MNLKLLLVVVALVASCATEPKPVPVPAGEREYCEREPDAPFCRHIR